MRFAMFTGAISFAVTCSFLLFLQSMELERELLERNAKATFLNIVLLTVIFFTIDIVYRKYTVERPVIDIIKAPDRITKGNFSVRIPGLKGGESFEIIADRINIMTEEFGSVETLRTDFIANVSHELKTPLAVMNNYGMLLQSPGLPECERLQYAKEVTAASRNLSELITNILRLNKLENQQIFPESRPYNLSEQLCECLLNFEDVWEKKKLDIDTDIEDDVIINADAEMLSLVWNNLFSNAVKFTDDSGRIYVSLKREKGYATVTDTGCGMSLETGRHIFEKFYQGDTSHQTKGNGLGLALVKRAADITGADISVQRQLCTAGLR